MADREPTVALKDVVDRFESSRGTLDELAGKLRDLALIEEAQRDDQAAIRDASRAMGTVAEQLERIVADIRDAVEATQQVTEAASEVLNASDAKSLHDRLDRISGELTQAFDDRIRVQREQTQQIGTQLDSISERLDAAEAAQARERELQAQLDRVRSGLSPRHLRKVGLAD